MREPRGEAMKKIIIIKKMMIVAVQIILGIVGGIFLTTLVNLIRKRRVKGQS